MCIVESLALLVAIIFLVMILCAVGSVVFALIQRKWSQIVAIVLAIPTMALGIWLLTIDVGSGARTLGGLVLIAGIAAMALAIWGLVRGHRARVS
ncbi:unannotated protein [freshwater metagenome]|uniref:Unannotated protein n=1 Tax=freshwater metagenome TaxID=449393 RepID=A0A6J7GHR1_9ZZZZ